MPIVTLRHVAESACILSYHIQVTTCPLLQRYSTNQIGVSFLCYQTPVPYCSEFIVNPKTSHRAARSLFQPCREACFRVVKKQKKKKKDAIGPQFEDREGSSPHNLEKSARAAVRPGSAQRRKTSCVATRLLRSSARYSTLQVSFIKLPYCTYQRQKLPYSLRICFTLSITPIEILSTFVEDFIYKTSRITFFFLQSTYHVFNLPNAVSETSLVTYFFWKMLWRSCDFS
jgi:hypothetical protein